MMRESKLGIVLLLGTLLGACSAPSTNSTPPGATPMTADKQSQAARPTPDPLLIAGGREWRLVELMGQPVVPGPGGRAPSLSFRTDAQGLSSVSGYSGCNHFSGGIELGPAQQRLRFGRLAATLRACPDMALEQRFMQVLEQADSYHADARQLQLHRARMAPLARFELAP